MIASLVIVIGVILLDQVRRLTQEELKKKKMKTGPYWVHPLLRDGRFDEIAKRYRKMSAATPRAVLRFAFLGLADLYQLNPDGAIPYFQQAMGGALGKTLNDLEHNVAVAYLQKGWVDKATAILEEHRRIHGRVSIVTYVLVLLLNGRRDDARRFYALNPITSGAKAGLEALLTFDPRRPASLNNARAIQHDPYWRLYHPVLPRLFAQWDAEVFFHDPNRCPRLVDQALLLLRQVEAAPAFFISPALQQMRRLLLVVSRRLESDEDCRSMHGLIHGYDEWAEELPVAEAVRQDWASFWRRLYYVIDHTAYPAVDPTQTDLWITRQLPAGSIRVHTRSPNSDLFLCPLMQKGVRVLRAFHPYPRVYAELMSFDEAERTAAWVEPLAAVLTEDDALRPILEPLIDAIVFDVQDVTPERIRDTLVRLPGRYRARLEGIFGDDPVEVDGVEAF